MRLSISTTTFDLNGHVSFDVTRNYTDIARVYRRASSATTLDGGVTVIDRGANELDQPLEFEWRTESFSQLSGLKTIVKNYPTVLVSWQDGVFLATPEIFEAGEERTTLTLLPIEKMSA